MAANLRILLHSFSGGQVSREFWSRVDDPKYRTGLKTCRNFLVRPQGPVENRPGTEYVRASKYPTRKSRLIPFVYSSSQSMVVQVGHGHFRFYTQGAVLLRGTPAAWSSGTAYTVGNMARSGGNDYYCILAHTNQAPPNATYWYQMPAGGEYEIPNQYDEADLFDIHYDQSADVLTLVHPSYPVYELRRYGATDWRIVAPTFASSLVPPTGVTAVASGGTGTTYSYVVTSVNDTAHDESVSSSAATCNGNLFASNAKNTVTWTAAPGSSRYRIYRLSGGLHGYVGQSDTTTFIDDNIAPDMSQTPPVAQTVFASAGNYPSAVSYSGQRRIFGGTNNEPQNIWMSKIGTTSNMDFSIPVRDDDSIQFRVTSRGLNYIRHIVPLDSLLFMTDSSEWRLVTVNSDAITQGSIDVKPQGYVGSNNVPPVIVGNTIIYSAARGGHVFEMAYSWQHSSYTSGDISIRAAELFDGFTITTMAYAKSPTPIVFATASSGRLLGLTYVPEHQVGAWHWHDTDGEFVSVCSVPEGDMDAVYFTVRRTINGSVVEYVERLHERRFDSLQDAFFVDCGLTYSGAPATVISGLSHLEGKTVSILADGAVMTRQVVTGGQVTLQNPSSIAHIGLPITADVETLPLSAEIDAYALGRQKNVSRIHLRVLSSSGILAGPTTDRLVHYKQRTNEPYGSPPSLITRELTIDVHPAWGTDASVVIRQSDPLPLTITGAVIEATLS